MSLSYESRLLCLLFGSFFLVYATTALVVVPCARPAVRAAWWLAWKSAARLVLTIRLAPLVLGVSISLGFCLPSYLWLEPPDMDEPVGWAFLIAALLGAVICGIAATRAVRAVLVSAAFAQHCEREGPAPIWIIRSHTPFLALAGIVRPRVVISREILNTLSADELSVAIRHENAHRTSGDNLRRLCILCAPLPPLSGFRDLEQAWTRFAEYAADEAAVAGDAGRAVALASALVRVARCGIAPPREFAISLVSDRSDLEARVDRLLSGGPLTDTQFRLSGKTAGFIVLFAGCLAAVVLRPSTFRFVQSLVERLIQ